MAEVDVACSGATAPLSSPHSACGRRGQQFSDVPRASVSLRSKCDRRCAACAGAADERRAAAG